MNLLGIAKGIGGLIGGFFGIGRSGGQAPVQTVAGVVDEYAYTKQEQAEDATARSKADTEYTAKMMIADSRSGTSPFDVLVDAVNRLQRPAWGFWFFGGLVGWWEFPTLADINPFWLTVFFIYFTALFGGRAVAKDLAGMILKIVQNWKGR